MSELPEVMTVREAAERLGFSPEWVRRCVNSGTLRGVYLKSGRDRRFGRWRVFADSVAEMLGEKEVVKHLPLRASTREEIARVRLAKAKLDLPRHARVAGT